MIKAADLGRPPRHAIGVLSPLQGTDTVPYGFYRLLGPDFIVVSTSLGLQSFAADDIQRAIGAIEKGLSHLVSRGADVILQSGTPLAVSLGSKGLMDLLQSIRNRCGLPVLSSALNAVEAAQALRVRKLVVANKWNPHINGQLRDFFAHWDIKVIASAAVSSEPAAFQSADLKASAELAYRLGQRVLEQAREADALFIGGGAWLIEPAAERLERDFGKPVITHVNAAVRGILKALDCWRPYPPGFGGVLETQ